MGRSASSASSVASAFFFSTNGSRWGRAFFFFRVDETSTTRKCTADVFIIPLTQICWFLLASRLSPRFVLTNQVHASDDRRTEEIEGELGREREARLRGEREVRAPVYTPHR